MSSPLPALPASPEPSSAAPPVARSMNPSPDHFVEAMSSPLTYESIPSPPPNPPVLRARAATVSSPLMVRCDSPLPSDLCANLCYVLRADSDPRSCVGGERASRRHCVAHAGCGRCGRARSKVPRCYPDPRLSVYWPWTCGPAAGIGADGGGPGHCIGTDRHASAAAPSPLGCCSGGKRGPITG